MKLVLHALHENELPFMNGGEPIEAAPEISSLLSLGVIIVTLIVTAVASLIKSSKDPSAQEPVLADADDTEGSDWKD